MGSSFYNAAERPRILQLSRFHQKNQDIRRSRSNGKAETSDSYDRTHLI